MATYALERRSAAAGAVALEALGVGAGDDVAGHELADAAGGLGAGVDRGANAADVAADDRGHERAADLDRLDDLDVGGLGHRVGRLDQRDPALGLDHAQRLAVAVAVVCHWTLSVARATRPCSSVRETRAGSPCHITSSRFPPSVRPRRPP